MSQKNRNIGFLVLFLFLFNILAISSMTHGAYDDYVLGVNGGETWLFTIEKNDIGDVNGEEGDTIEVKCVEIEEIVPGKDIGSWKIELDVGHDDDPGGTQLAFDPSECDLYTIPTFLCAHTIELYLEELAEKWNAAKAGCMTVEGNSYTLDATGMSQNIFQSTNKWEIEFSDEGAGWAEEYKAYKDGVLVTHLIGESPPDDDKDDDSASSGIPGYQLPVMIGMIAISSLVIILMHKKREKTL